MTILRASAAALFLLVVGAGPAAAQALDCSGAIPLECNAGPTTFTQGLGNSASTSYCGMAGFSGQGAVFLIDVVEATELSVIVDDPDSELILMASCDASNCIATGVPVPGGKEISACLEPGVYVVASDALHGGERSVGIRADCIQCTPVASRRMSWSTAKASH